MVITASFIIELSICVKVRYSNILRWGSTALNEGMVSECGVMGSFGPNLLLMTISIVVVAALITSLPQYVTLASLKFR